MVSQENSLLDTYKIKHSFLKSKLYKNNQAGL